MKDEDLKLFFFNSICLPYYIIFFVYPKKKIQHQKIQQKNLEYNLFVMIVASRVIDLSTSL